MINLIILRHVIIINNKVSKIFSQNILTNAKAKFYLCNFLTILLFCLLSGIIILLIMKLTY